MSDQEQIRRDAEAVSSGPALSYATHCLALLAELEQAERERDEAARVLGELTEETLYVVAGKHQAEAKADSLAEILRKTIYTPPGYTGPDMWWADEARAALAEWEQR